MKIQDWKRVDVVVPNMRYVVGTIGERSGQLSKESRTVVSAVSKDAGFTNAEAPSMRILSFNCAGCSAPLQIKPDTTEFVCAYCGSAQVVDRTGGAVTLSLVAKGLERVQRGTDKTASELALVRLNNELGLLHCPQVPPPTIPFVERKSLLGFLMDFLLGRGPAALISRRMWAEYDKQMLDWPPIEAANKSKLALYWLDRELIEHEISRHLTIVRMR